MKPNHEGKKIPQVVFKTFKNGGFVDVSSESIFKGKKVVLFGLPGAFTPTCSSQHLPGYNAKAAEFKALGVDTIVCLAVNDAFVMNAWEKDLNVSNVTLIPDGNGAFSKGLGLLTDFSAIGFGDRCWRHSMLVEDCVIKKMFIEPEKEGDPFEVSDAETMLKYLQG